MSPSFPDPADCGRPHARRLPPWMLGLLVIACSDGSTGPGDLTAPVDSVPVLAELPDHLGGLELEQAVPYEPRSALWSNGLDKQRSVLLPTGSRIDLSDRDAWGFPEGALLIKTFSMR